MFDFEYWEKELIGICGLIDKNLLMVNEDNRTFVASNVLNNLRNLVEAVYSLIYCKRENISGNNRYQIIQDSISYAHKINCYRFLDTFHDCLQITLSHYSLFNEYADRMILKYSKYLAQIKEMLAKDFGIKVLSNLTKLPLDLDRTLEQYYRQIKTVLNVDYGHSNKSGTDTFYVQKKKAIYIDDTLFYEYTLMNGLDNVSKFDRFIVFSKIDIFDNYAIRCKFEKKFIPFFGKSVPVSLIVDYWVAIRPCELDKFSRIFGYNHKHKRTEQYERLMDYIKKKRVTLGEILEYSDEDFNSLIEEITVSKMQNTALIYLLKESRDFLKEKTTGYNTVKYLSAILINSILRNQLNDFSNDNVSGLFLKNGVLIFDSTPFSGSLIKHNPPFGILISLFNFNDYKDDIFASHVINESNNTASIYLPIADDDLNEADLLIEKYNSRVSYKSEKRMLARYGKKVYIQENEIFSKNVLKSLVNMSECINFPNYKMYAKSFIDRGIVQFDDILKKECAETMFDNTSLFCIYGAAGTGKSTLISKELQILGNIPKLCLANTHPALRNLVRKIDDSYTDFKTIKSFISSRNTDIAYDVVVIDECSNISTIDLYKVLQKVRTKLLILAGDIYQLPAIQFGNWFALLRNFIDKKSYIDLLHTYRCDEQNPLINLWDKVRRIDPTIQETLATFEISHVFDSSIFRKIDKDEIILNLNYDGLYGINNLNKLLQISNPAEEITWKQYSFKVGDPVIFNETTRFDGYLYNNLKGEIKKIHISENNDINFDIEVDTVLNPLITYRGFKLLESSNIEKSLISLTVLNSKESDYDRDTDESNKIPFEIAYAVSIHKAQGLEYDSVKLIITKEAEEKISHNVFYTAITRAKKTLKIFWSPESENNIIKAFQLKNVNKDAQILSNKFGLKIFKND